MKKLQRFVILSILFILLWILGYCIIPTIVYIFGGSFLEVCQNMAYVFLIGIVIIPAGLGIIFSDCFNSQFYSKK
jgi:hypothetical protein